eukprot:6023258-Prymnesium_polylepis.1
MCRLLAPFRLLPHRGDSDCMSHDPRCCGVAARPARGCCGGYDDPCVVLPCVRGTDPAIPSCRVAVVACVRTANGKTPGRARSGGMSGSTAGLRACMVYYSASHTHKLFTFGRKPGLDPKSQ